MEDGNHEYERVGEYRITKITNLEKNDPQETPCTLPQNKQEDAVWVQIRSANTANT